MIFTPRARNSSWLLMVLLVMAAGWPAAAAADGHPRLLLSPADIPALRAKITKQPYAAMVQRLKADAEDDMGEGDWPPTGAYYGSGNTSIKCGFLYVLTGDDVWAAKAMAKTKVIIDNPKWDQTRTKGLNLYLNARGVALTYDFCAGSPSWGSGPGSFTATVSRKLKDIGELLVANPGNEYNHSQVSNWHANRFAGAGLALLATDESYAQDLLETCWTNIVTHCTASFGTGSGPGWSAEGLGYFSYPWGDFIGPFGIAMQRKDPAKDLRTAHPRVPFAYWTMYAGSLRMPGRAYSWPGPVAFPLRHDFGDDNPQLLGEGCYGQAFWYSPAEFKPALVTMYDQLVGEGGDKSWDNARAGTIYSILFHPGTTIPKADPQSIPAWRNLGMDTPGGNGFFLYRNRYSGTDADIAAMLMVRTRGNPGGHWGPDGLGFRILGLGGSFAVGGGRYSGGNPYWRMQNTLYPVEPITGAVAITKNAGVAVGTPSLAADGSGTVVGRMTKNSVGTDNHTRRFLSDFSKASGAAAVFVVADTSDNGKWWQYTTIQGHAVTIDAKGFTVTAPNGATLRATFVYQAGALQLATGSLKRGSEYVFNGNVIPDNTWVTANSDDGDFLVVMTMMPKGGKHPEVASSSGNAVTDRVITIGGLTVAIGADSIAVAPSVPRRPPIR